MGKFPGRVATDPIIRFARYINKTDTCWLWTGKIARNGYGHFHIPHRGHLGAHRFAYELHYGPILPGFQVCHRCDVRACVRPDHLFLGNNFDNMQDASRKGRMPIGERNTHAKLTPEQVLEIRALEGKERPTHIAKRYHVTMQNITAIWKRKSWKHI